jgi:prepilin-type N-terminal cleavage/methylation domain-containing protein
MCNVRKFRRGFTLIELLIVVVILGVLASISVPQFANAGEDARRSSLAATIHSLNHQIQLYKLEHGDQLPDLAAASAAGTHFQPLVGVTTFDSRTRGPYALSIPVNPLTGGSVVKDAATFTGGVPDPVPGADFVYDYAGGGAIWGTADRATGRVR